MSACPVITPPTNRARRGSREFDTDTEPGGDLAPDIDRHAGRREGCPLG